MANRAQWQDSEQGGVEIEVDYGTGATVPPELEGVLASLQAGKLVLCTGAGFGQVAGRPTWRELAERLTDRMVDVETAAEVRELLETHPLAAASYIKRSLGQAFRGELTRLIPSNGKLPLDMAVLSSLPFRAVITTALDDVVERVYRDFRRANRALPPVYTHRDAEKLRAQGRGRYVLRLFGDPRQGSDGDVIFGGSDIQRLMQDSHLRGLVADLAQKRSFLFLGFAAEDPDFELLVERVLGLSKAAPGAHPQHYAILPGLSRVAREELQASYGIQVLPEQDGLFMLQELRAALGEDGVDALPDDDDLEGWLAFLQKEPGRAHDEDVELRLRALERRLLQEKQSDRLLELWLGLIDVESAPAMRATLLLQVTQVLERDKGQMAEAFQSALAAYREDPQATTLDTLERLAGITGLWVELLTELRDHVTQLAISDRFAVWLRIARIYGDRLNHVDYALASLAEARKLEAPPAALQQELLELTVELCRRGQRWKELADALGALAPLVADTSRKLDLYLEQGEVLDSRLSDGAGAAQAFRRGLEVEPTSRDALTALEHLLRRGKRWEELALILEQKASLLRLLGEDDAALRALREAATLTEGHLGADDGLARDAAILRWEAVRREAPTDLEALRALEKLYGQDSRYAERYLQAVAELAAHVATDKERLQLYRRLAAEYEEMPGRLEEAAACLERVLEIDPKAEDSYRGLERVYRQLRNWTFLADTYRRHAEHATSGQVALYLAQGQIHDVEIPAGERRQALLSAPQALDAYAQVLRLEPDNEIALEALTRLYLLTEQYQDAVRLLQRRANLAEDKAQRAELRYQAAEVLLTHLKDARGAEEGYTRALEADADHFPSLRGLAALYREQGDLLRAAKLLTEAAQRNPNRLEKARCLTEAAAGYQVVGDTPRAIELYQQVLADDPEAEAAGARLAGLLLQEKRPADAVPVLEMLVRKAGTRTEQLTWLNLLGGALRDLGETQRALRIYARAVELDESDMGAQRGRAQLLEAAGQWQGARDAWMALLTYGREQLSNADVVDVLAALGHCERSLGHPAEARDFYQRALEMDPAHRPSLRALIELGDSAEISKETQADLRRVLILSSDTEEKIKLLTEVGDLQAGPMQDYVGALLTYQEALELKPDSHVLLHKCLELHSQLGDWPLVVSVLERLIALEPNAKRRARYKQTAAVAARDELLDAPRALALFSAALDDDPTLERSSADLEKLAREKGEHRELARHYRRKIKWLGADIDSDTPELRAERIRLWTGLGVVCIEHLNDQETGLAAFEVVAALDRGNLEWRRQLARLYVATGAGHPDRLDKAIAEHQALLRANKAELSSYRALKELYLQTQRRERAASVAQALVILRKADEDDEKLIAEFRARAVKPARRALKAELWKTLIHPEEDAQIGALFQVVFPSVQLGYVKSFKEAGIHRKDALDSALLCAKALRYAVEVLEAVPVDSYAQQSLKEPYAVQHCGERGQPPVVCVQLGAPLLNPQRAEAEVLYEVGRLATFLHPRRVLRTLLPTVAQLSMVVDAAMLLGGGDPASAQPKVQETAHGLKRALTPALLEQVVLIGKHLREAGGKGDALVTSWLAWSEITAARVGLVLCGDLEAVALIMATEPPGATLTPKQRLLELLHFAVTEEYFAVRQYLGLMS